MSYRVMFKDSFPLQTPILKLLYLKHCGQCHCENLYSAIKNHLDWHPRLFLSLPSILKGQRNQQDTVFPSFCFRRHQLLSVTFCAVFLCAFSITLPTKSHHLRKPGLATLLPPSKELSAHAHSFLSYFPHPM